MARAPLVFIALVCLFVGTIFLFIGGSTVLEKRRYEQFGAHTVAVATGKALQRATAESNTAYEISYRVTLPDGSAFDHTERVPVHVWERVERHASIDVKYVPGSPPSARVIRDRSVEGWRGRGALAIGLILVAGGLTAANAAVRRRPGRVAEQSSTPAAGPPETSFWPRARRSMGLWIGGMCLLAGLPVLLTGAYRVYDEWCFWREAVTAEGMVLTKEITSSGTRRRSRSKQYDVTYRYIVRGQTFEARDAISRVAWERLVERQPVDMRYRPARPSSSHLAAHDQWFKKAMMTLVGSIFTAVGATMSWGSIRGARLERRLRRHGFNVPGTVTEIHPCNVKIDGKDQWRLQYEYQDFQGQRRTSTVDMGPDEINEWEVGDIGRVLYDPSHPRQAVWLGHG